MAHFSITFLLISVIVLIIISAFFSGSEVGMMSINRYRLRHLAKKRKLKSAKLTLNLVSKPDRLLGVILIGNTFANILAASLTTLLATQLWGDVGVGIATVILTIVVLIFAEISPKTLAAQYPQKIAFAAALPLTILLWILYPFVWISNIIANTFLRLFGIKPSLKSAEALSADEIRSAVHASEQKLTSKNKFMLLGVLDLEHATMADVMIPRHKISGIDINNTWDSILTQIVNCEHSRIPIYHENIDNIIGILHIAKAAKLLTQPDANLEALLKVVSDPYFIPETTTLQKQIIQFQKHKQRIGLVVDEYGDIQGMVSLEDILEEVVGELSDHPYAGGKTIRKQKDGSFLVHGSTTLRDINRILNFTLPLKGPKTLSGLITKELDALPSIKTCLLIEGYPIEIMKVEGNAVKKAKIKPRQAPYDHAEH